MPPRDLPPARVRRELLAFATELVEQAATYATRRCGGAQARVRWKGAGDPITAVDEAIEERIRVRLAREFPSHGFLGEESGAEGLDREHVWLVDPIDGTSNYSRGLTPWAIALACLHHGRPLVAAVHLAPGPQLFRAARGLGAWHGRKRLRIPRGALGARALVGLQWARGAAMPAAMRRLVEKGARIRQMGCTVGQLCGVALGHLDANVQTRGRLWDLAAPALIVEEAGGRVTDWQGSPVFQGRPHPRADLATVAAHPSLHRQILRQMRTVVSGA